MERKRVSSKRIVVSRVAGLCGITAPIIVSFLVVLAVSYSPWFSWTENALSDIGVRGIAAILFNSGLIIGGILALIFAIGLGQLLTNRMLGRVGSLLLSLAAVALCSIGIFPETAGTLHYVVSVAFFVLLPLSLFFLGAALLQEPTERSLGAFAVLAGAVATAVWALPWEGLAIPEAIAYLAASLWSMTLSVKMLRQANRQ